MTDLDMARIKSDAIDATYRAEPLADDVLALLDEIESLEAERDGLMITNTHMLSYSRAAEARLARVTDDSMAQRITQEAPSIVTRSGGYLGISDAALLIIRAVAADEQEATEHNHKPVQHRDGKPPWCKVCGLTADGLKPIARWEMNRQGSLSTERPGDA